MCCFHVLLQCRMLRPVGGYYITSLSLRRPVLRPSILSNQVSQARHSRYAVYSQSACSHARKWLTTSSTMRPKNVDVPANSWAFPTISRQSARYCSPLLYVPLVLIVSVFMLLLFYPANIHQFYIKPTQKLRKL